MKKSDIIVSGMRPTGRLHLGNHWGALKNWVELSKQGQCYFFVADWHMLTTGYEDTAGLQDNVREMVLDWLAAGLDPEKAVLFKQSAVPEHAELAVLLGMVTPLSWLENNPTWKEQLQELAVTKHAQAAAKAPRKHAPSEVTTAIGEMIEGVETAQQSLRTFGFLGYPVLQTADILLYHGTKVPVGQDQLPHVELSREIARKFNSTYGETLTEPQPLLTRTPKVPGTDGRKMSKSYGNAVDLYESEASLQKKVMGTYTDPKKVRANDPGHPLPCADNPPGCAVFALHQLYAEAPFVVRRETECKSGQVGCVACKKDLLKELDGPFGEFRRAREDYASRKGLVEGILEEGARKARIVAQRTMAEVRRAMRLS